MKRLLPELTKRLAHLHPTASQLAVPKFQAKPPQEESSIISQEWLWPRVSAFFREKDIIIAETGTSAFGVLDIPLPKGAIFVAQILWGSIGWTGGMLRYTKFVFARKILTCDQVLLLELPSLRGIEALDVQFYSLAMEAC